jgi:hypothetical protein
LTGKASFEAAQRIEREERINTVALERKEKFYLVWKLYIPAGISATMTVTCIFAASRVSTRRTAVVTAAYSLSEKAFAEYREKIIERLGEDKEQDIRDEIVEDRIKKDPPSERQLVLAEPGNVLCCEMYTGRYFHSDMESLRRAENEINAKMLREGYANLEDFYYMIDLPYTSDSAVMGWTSDQLLDLIFTAVMSENKSKKQPCIGFTYNYVKPII